MRTHDVTSRMPERARTDLWEPQGSNPLGPPGPEPSVPGTFVRNCVWCPRNLSPEPVWCPRNLRTFVRPELRMVSLRQESFGKEEETRALKPFVETLRVRIPPGKAGPAARSESCV